MASTLHLMRKRFKPLPLNQKFKISKRNSIFKLNLKPIVSLLFLLFITQFSFSQVEIEWSERHTVSIINSYLSKTSDNGYIFSAYSGYNQIKALKTDSEGNEQWRHVFEANFEVSHDGVIELADGNYMIGGTADLDFWLAKFNAAGDIIWENTYGTDSTERLNHFEQTEDGGFIVMGIRGSSFQNAIDIWILKLDANGNVEWESTYGGSALDYFCELTVTENGDYLIAASTNSTDGDITGNNNGVTDIWIFKLGANGNILWDKTYGGGNPEYPSDIETTSDGGIIIVSSSYSDDFDITGGNNGEDDFWILKLDESGNKEWDKTYGGSGRDTPRSIKETIDGGYIVSGTSESNDGDVSGNYGGSDIWVVKLDANGEKEWDKNFGGSSDDRSGFVLPEGEDYVTLGYTISEDGDLEVNNAFGNAWLFKLKTICQNSEHPDYDALVAFYNSTNGDNWTNNNEWLEDCDPCNWFGVQCNAAGRVTQLFLANNNVSGSLPAEIGDLTELQNLTIFSDNLSGSIPSQIGNLSNLEALILSNNQLSGNIPPSIGNLSNLEFLTLSNNQLTGSIPTSFANLTNLNSSSGLSLNDNNLSGCYDLELKQGNSILCNFTNEEISEGNNFNADWETFCSANFGACPCEHPDYEALVSLYAFTNGENWTNNNGWLEDCEPCNWNGVICDGNGRVSILSLTNNNLTGQLPEEIGDLSELTEIYLFNNSISGEIPVSLGNLNNLSSLYLRQNNFEGNIPTELGDLTSLTDLDLTQNNLEGGIPNSFVSLDNLTHFDISYNQLNGCYDAMLKGGSSVLCNFSNTTISNGNNFDALWEDFCSSDEGICNPDTDGDGIEDSVDNCPSIQNPNQEDLDQDNIGDVCDEDADGDGYDNTVDCDDFDSSVGLATIWYADTDNDGFGDINNIVEDCTQPSGYVDNADDCDDTSENINPDAIEIANDGIDQDCDGVDLVETTECLTPTNVLITRIADNQAEFTSVEDINAHYQGSANLHGRPLRPRPMYGMTDIMVGHVQTVVPVFEYDIWFRTICENGMYSDWTGPFYLPLFSENNLTISPNPTQGDIKIGNVEAPIESVEIFDASGMFLMEIEIDSSNMFNISKLPSGRYNLKITDVAGNVTLKKVINK